MPKQDLEKLIKKLVELGEDKHELNLWLSIYDDLEIDEQQKLMSGLEDELKQLEKLAQQR